MVGNIFKSDEVAVPKSPFAISPIKGSNERRDLEGDLLKGGLPNIEMIVLPVDVISLCVLSYNDANLFMNVANCGQSQSGNSCSGIVSFRLITKE